MKASVLSGVGEPLVLQEEPVPSPGPAEAVVQVRSAALNRRDVWIRKGQYAGLRFPIILGSDCSGVVSHVGEGVDDSWRGRSVVVNPALAWGDRSEAQNFRSFNILGLPRNGTFAEFVCVPAENLFDRPDYLDEQEAAALPLAALTAFRATVHRGAVSPDENVLVTGAGGGAATFAIQIASTIGANVFVTSGSKYKLEMAKEIGALGGADYRDESWVDQLKGTAGGFDLIIDSAGGEGFGKLLDLASPGGRIVFYGATTGNPPLLDSRRVFWKQLSLLGSTMGSPLDFAAMLHFFELHKLRPVIDKCFPLSEANEALNHMEGGRQMGKILLTVS